MCGIVGYLSFDGVMPKACDLSEAVDLLQHRGPDDRGTWRSNQTMLGFRRLSIQDLSRNGHQPMASDDGRYVIVFNGEIYNFKLLRKQLCENGFAFRTGTDTEVLLRLFQLEGARCLGRLNGMFAFAIHDTIEGTLFLARDRFGEKPLYTLKDRRGFVFASELKALVPFVRRLAMSWDLNADRVFEYAAFRYVSGEDTLVTNVRKLAPGSWLTVAGGGSTCPGVFYDLAAVCGDRDDADEMTEAEHVERARELLKDSIRLRMISDAPIGVALSGGVDSSLVTALMREVHDGRIETFSVTFNEKQVDGRTIDESAYSDFVARKFGTDHHRLTLDEGLCSKLYPKCVWHNDEPLNFPHSMGIYLLAQFASERVKVLLCGEGADEAFAGYTYFTQPRLDHRKHRFARFTDIRKLLSRRVPQDLSSRMRVVEECPSDGINGEICFSLRTYLTTIENRLDKMSMANGLEMRLPFLDPRVVERSLRLPDRFKVGRQTTKYLLKKLAEPYIPKEQIYRPKVGFSTPLNQWLRTRKLLGQYVDVLREERTLARPIYNREAILTLLKRFWDGPETFQYSFAGRVWILMNLELWIRVFLEGERF